MQHSFQSSNVNLLWSVTDSSANRTRNYRHFVVGIFWRTLKKEIGLRDGAARVIHQEAAFLPYQIKIVIIVNTLTIDLDTGNHELTSHDAAFPWKQQRRFCEDRSPTQDLHSRKRNGLAKVVSIKMLQRTLVTLSQQNSHVAVLKQQHFFLWNWGYITKLDDFNWPVGDWRQRR